MYESARTPVKPRDIRRRACALMKQCWLTLLIGAVLMSLFSWVSLAVEAHGEKLATEAYHAQMQIYDSEKPTLPFEDDNAMLDDLLNQHRIERMAEEAYDDAFAPWEWLSNGLGLVGLLFQCVIAVRLSQGLLAALRGGECTPHCLLSGFTRTATACWLGLQRGLRILGWMLIPLPFSVLLSLIFNSYVDLVASLLSMLICLWATLHYALAEVHLADDPYDSLTATEAIRLAVDDAGAFGIWQMCKVLWPVVLPFVVIMAVPLLELIAPVPGAVENIVLGLYSMVTSVFPLACYICIYDETRQRIRAAEEAVPANEGLARARALAADTERKISHV